MLKYFGGKKIEWVDKDTGYLIFKSREYYSAFYKKIKNHRSLIKMCSSLDPFEWTCWGTFHINGERYTIFNDSQEYIPRFERNYKYEVRICDWKNNWLAGFDDLSEAKKYADKRIKVIKEMEASKELATCEGFKRWISIYEPTNSGEKIVYEV